MLNIDQLAYSNRLRYVHPVEKFIFSIVTMGLCLAFTSIHLYAAVVVLMGFGVLALARIPWQVYLRLMLLPAGFLFIGVLTVIISVGGTGYDWIYRWNLGPLSLGIRHTDLVLGLNIFGKALAAVSCLYFLSLTTPMVEMISVLKRLRVPALFIELMGLVYRFIFVLMETAQKIHTSQSSRCGYATLATSYRSTSQLISSLFAKSFQRSSMLFTALTARGYTGDLQVLEPEFNYSKRNIGMIVLIELGLLFTALMFGGSVL
ncbi:cobalt ABC transporter permease [Thermincola ferriacetica]|uniref:Cobalt ABC transporter permease n=1 Tax=Thermincola ferriacetica TaxID=281456 RepID=A0A0L6W6Y6_9FIRM|nr:cobalt ECF transporter T component CbiQ [Thermincola ferriacetica]KNZ71143.1 cobalt ABC transporter permease [Thermincola ferriacetica]